jgi:LPXTG-site transpeptidase (sortase) family protein
LAVYALLFVGVVYILAQVDLLPESPPAGVAGVVAPTTAPVAATSSAPTLVEDPLKIEIPAINLSATIENPTTTNIDALDKLLLKGAVRYPTSAKLGETGNVVLFGHSSYLPVVLNQAYKAFNGIQKLVVGDTVTIYSSDTAYAYVVATVSKESTNDAGIPLQVSGRVLTLATCDSFGATTDRFVVVANFVESHPISI